MSIVVSYRLNDGGGGKFRLKENDPVYRLPHKNERIFVDIGLPNGPVALVVEDIDWVVSDTNRIPSLDALPVYSREVTIVCREFKLDVDITPDR